MPDLTIEYHWMCSSCESWSCQVPSSKPGKKPYTVSYHYWAITPDSDGWECDCKGFKFRKKCTHVDRAKAAHCSWHGQFDEGESDVDPENPKCPRCGAEAVSVRCAV